MYKIVIILMVLTIKYSIVKTQSSFERVINNANSGYFILSMIKTYNGGYIMGGYDNYLNFYIANLDSSANILWTRQLGSNGWNTICSIVQTQDSGFTAGGYTNALGVGGEDFFIVKFNKNGIPQWVETIGGPSNDFCFAMAKTNDGGYIMAGKSISYFSYANILIVKLQSNGSVQWSKTIQVMGIDDIATSIIQTSDGSYVLAGAELHNGNNYRCYIAKLNNNGVLQWNREVGRLGSADENYAESIIETSDGGYAIAGYNNLNGGNYELYIVKFTSSGNLQWSRTIKDGSSSDLRAYSLIQTLDGGYAVSGSAGYENIGLLVKLDNEAFPQWCRMFPDPYVCAFSSVIQNSDGSYIAGGNSSSIGGGGVLIVKFEDNGNTCSTYQTTQLSVDSVGILGTPTPTINSVFPTVISQSIGYVSTGTLVTLCVTGIKKTSFKIPNSFELLQNYPNPFNPSTNIKYQLPKTSEVKLSVYDINGKEIAVLVNEKQNPGTYEIEWNASNFASGVYFYKLVVLDPETISGFHFEQTKKMILLK